MSEAQGDSEKFGLGWPAVAMLMLYVAAALFKGDWRSLEAQEQGYRLGNAVVSGLLICGVVGWGAFRLGKRSRRAATAATCAALLIVGVAGFAKRPSPEATAKRIVAKVLDDLEAQRRAYEAMGPQLKASLSDPARLSAQSAVSEQMQVVLQAIGASQSLLDKGNAAEGRISRQLHEAGFSDAEVEPLLESLRSKLNWERGRMLHGLDLRILTDYRDMLQVMRQEAGKYSSGSTIADFHFRNRAAADRFARLVADLDEAGRRQDSMVSNHVAAVDVGE